MNKKNQNNENLNMNNQNVENVESQVEKAFVEDPLFVFIKKWQNVIFWGLLVIIAGYYGYQKYSEIRINEQKEDADLFDEFRPIYANIITLSNDIKTKELEINQAIKEKKNVEASKKDLDGLKERLNKSLIEANSRIKPLVASKYYGQTARLYSALLKKSQGDIKGFENEINTFNFSKFNEEKDDAQRFYKELALISVAKSYLDDTDKLAEGKKLLIDLAQNGKFLNVVAYKSLQYVLNGDEEAMLRDIKDSIIRTYPEQAELLK